MNETYLRGAHAALRVEDNYETWWNAVKDDEQYLRGMHGHLGVEDDYETWKSAVWGGRTKETQIDGTQDKPEKTDEEVFSVNDDFEYTIDKTGRDVRNVKVGEHIDTDYWQNSDISRGDFVDNGDGTYTYTDWGRGGKKITLGPDNKYVQKLNAEKRAYNLIYGGEQATTDDVSLLGYLSDKTIGDVTLGDLNNFNAVSKLDLINLDAETIANPGNRLEESDMPEVAVNDLRQQKDVVLQQLRKDYGKYGFGFDKRFSGAKSSIQIRSSVDLDGDGANDVRTFRIGVTTKGKVMDAVTAEMNAWMKARAFTTPAGEADAALDVYKNNDEEKRNNKVKASQTMDEFRKARKERNQALEELKALHPNLDFQDPKTWQEVNQGAVYKKYKKANDKYLKLKSTVDQQVKNEKHSEAIRRLADKLVSEDKITEEDKDDFIKRLLKDGIPKEHANAYSNIIRGISTKEIEERVVNNIAKDLNAKNIEDKVREDIGTEGNIIAKSKYQKNLDQLTKEEKEEVAKLLKNEVVKYESQALVINDLLEDTAKEMQPLMEWLEKNSLEVVQAKIDKIRNRKYTSKEDQDRANRQINQLVQEYKGKAEAFNSLQETYVVNVKVAKKLRKDLEKIQLKDEDIKSLSTALGKNYTTGAMMGISLLNATIDLFQGLETAVYMINPFGALSDNLIETGQIKRKFGQLDPTIKSAIFASKYFSPGGGQSPLSTSKTIRSKIHEAIDGWQETMAEKVAAPVAFDEINGLADFGQWAGSMIAGQIPNLALMYATGGASLYVMGGSAAGSKFSDLQSQRQEYIDSGGLYGHNYSFGQMFLNSALTGTAEALSERITLGQIKYAKGLMNSKAWKLGFGNQMADQLFNWNNLKRMGVDLFEEGASEAAATISENFLNKSIGQNVSLFDNVAESFVSGLMISGTISSAPMFKAAYSTFAHPDNNKKIAENSNKIKEKSKMMLSKNIAPKSKAQLEEEIAELTLENQTLIEKDIKKVDSLKDQEKREIIEIENKNYKLRERAESIMKEKDISDTKKAEMIQGYQNEVNKNIAKKEEILNRYTDQQVEDNYQKVMKTTKKNIDKVNKLSKYNVVLKEGNTDQMVKWQNEQNDKYEMDSIDVDTVNDKGETVTESVPMATALIPLIQAEQSVLADPRSTKAEKAEAKKAIAELTDMGKSANLIKGNGAKYGSIVPQVKDGKLTGFEIFINKESSVKNGMITTAAHEFLHAALFSTLKMDTNTQINFGHSFLNEFNLGVKSGYINVKPGSRIAERISAYSYKEGRGEEIMTIISEAMIKGDVTFNENVLTRFGNVVRRTLQAAGVEIKFNTGNDVFNFIKDFSNTIKSGKVLNKAMLNVIAKGGEGKLVERAADGDLVRIQSMMSKEGRSNLQGKLDAVDGDKVALMTDMLDTGQDFENSKFAKEIGGITESITQRLFDPLAIKAADSLDVIPGTLKVDGAKVTGTKRNAYKKALVEKAINLVIREYEVGTQPLDKFVSTRLALRANALATELGVPQEFTTKIEKVSESEFEGFGEVVNEQQQKFEEQDIRAQMLAEARGEKTPDGLPLVLNTIGKTELISKVNNIVKKAKLNLADIKSIKDVKALVTKKGGPLNGILDLVASEFGVESSRIIKNQTLNADQRTPAKEFINSKAEAFKKMLIKGDTADGKATGAANTALDVFYIKGDRVAAAQTGSTQGKKTQVLNPNITTDSFKKAFEGKGTSKDSIIKALIAQVATVAANQAIRKTAPKGTPQSVISKIGDGMSSAYFSKTISNKLQSPILGQTEVGIYIIDKLQNSANKIDQKNYKQKIKQIFADEVNRGLLSEKDINKIIEDVSKVAKIIPKKANPSEIVDLQGGTVGEYIVNEVVGDALAAIEKGTYDNLVRRRGIEVDASKNLTNTDGIKEGTTFVGEVRVAQNKLSNILDSKFGKGYSERFLFSGISNPSKIGNGSLTIKNNTFNNVQKTKGFKPYRINKKGKRVPQTNRFGYTTSAADTRTVIGSDGSLGKFTKQHPKTTWGADKIKTMQQVRDIADNDAAGIIQSQKENNEAYRQVVEELKTLYEAGDVSIEAVIAILQNMNSSPQGLTRTSAILDFIPLGEHKGPFRLEHMTPAIGINMAALDFIVSGKDAKTAQMFYDMMAGYKVTYLPKKYDDIVNENFKQKMPKFWNPSLPSIFRYFNLYNPGFDLQFKQISTGDIIGPSIVKSPTEQQKAINNDKKALGAFYNKSMTNSEVKKGKDILIKTMLSKNINQDGKGGSVWDFDDTIARSKSKVISTAPDGKTVSLTAEQFADQGAALLQQGHKFDFSEFNKVVKGEKGPFFKKFADRIKKFGVKDNFILTARPVESAPAIKAFLKSQGINIPLKNITALANSTPEAKALWIAENMISEGYNNIYFADDALQNVQAVKNIMDQFDVKGKVQQAKAQFSKDAPAKMDEILMDGEIDIDSDFNSIIDEKLEGKRKKNKFKFFIPPSAEDFEGLLYPLLGKGKEGEKHHKFFKEKLFDPFAKGVRALNMVTQDIANNVKALKKDIPGISKKLRKTVPGTDFTLDDAARVYLWDKAGYDIPGLSKGDKAKLLRAVRKNNSVQTYAENISQVADKLNGYPEPDNNWQVGNINYDMSSLSRQNRDSFLQEWSDNVDVLFSDKNLRKLEKLLGRDYVESLKDIIHRMKTGSNRSLSKYKFVNDFMDWTNGSIATTMFINIRSAVLQTLSTVNFVNWHDNNILAAGKALANLPQFTKDFTMIFNSDFLTQRRGGLQMDLNANEMLKSIQDSKNPVRAAIGWILKQGFKPTQIMDSFAIAFGGATMYRNRVNTYVKQGISPTEAQSKAFNDMMEIAEATQQSSRPDRISSQQASPLGKLILAFQNTPMQYMRLTKKAGLDLLNGRGDAKTNISKIIYYAGVQNVIFYGMQQALFALAFGDDEDEDEEKRKRFEDKKKLRFVNGMMDTVLRGSGIAGAVVSTVKNSLLTYMEQRKKWDPDHGYTMIELLNLSPPIGIKARKLYTGAIKNYEWNEDVIKHMSKTDIDNPIYKALFSTIEATTNIPLARAQSKLNNIREAFDSDNKDWQRIALFMGWSTWDLGIQNDELADIKDEITEIKKLERKEKREKEKAEKEEQLEQEFKEQQKEERKEGKKEITCIAVNKDGKRCGLKVVGGGSYCTVHQKVEQGDKEVQCSKIKSDGKRCKMKTKNKSGLCYYHD